MSLTIQEIFVSHAEKQQFALQAAKLYRNICHHLRVSLNEDRPRWIRSVLQNRKESITRSADRYFLAKVKPNRFMTTSCKYLYIDIYICVYTDVYCPSIGFFKFAYLEQFLLGDRGRGGFVGFSYLFLFGNISLSGKLVNSFNIVPLHCICF